MFKYILTFIGTIFLFNSANAGNADTAIFYYKYHTTGFNRVSTLDSADFFRMILPPDGDDTLINVREFYKNGKIKFAGKSYTKSTDAFQTGVILFAGNCVNYFPDGKKQSIVHYEEGEKIGLEYSYYPMGGIYCTKKYIYQGKAFHPKALNWECYDIDGTQICDKGNGHWKLYDDEFKRIRLEGMVKNGLEDGEWRGSSAIRPGEHQSIDTIKFTYRFNKGTFVSGTGYSKSGTPYTFKQDIKGPSYLKEPIDFIRILRSKLKIPKDTNGIKMNTDAIHFSFVIETDGSLSTPQVTGCTNADFIEVFKSTLLTWKGWDPCRYYGIPLRTKLILPYKELGKFDGPFYMRQIKYQEQILGF